MDIGGGRGKFLAHLLRRYPQACGMLFDLETVVHQQEWLALEETRDRCHLIAGSFFDFCPKGMMAIFSGKERTRAEFETMLAAQGFAITSIKESKTGLSIIEVTKR